MHTPLRPSSWAPVLGLMFALLPLQGALAEPPAAEVPQPLEPWVGWVLHGHEATLCPAVGEQAVCLWPGVLELEAGATQGVFRLELEADRELYAPLPGNDQLWPLEVTLDGQPTPVIAVAGRPAIRVEEGQHRIRGVFTWSEVPETLPVPPATALVSLRVGGREIVHPRVEEGVLWLQGQAGQESEEDRLDLDVFRRVDDGVPLMITTRLDLRVAGKPREVDLGTALLEQTVAVSLSSGLPARLDEDGHLVVQVISGTWTVEVVGRTRVSPESLIAPTREAPWPEVETWVFAAGEALRTVDISGAPGVDPARTALPQEWRSLPAYLMEGGTQLVFEEIRRGESEPPPDQLSLHRTVWLDHHGGGLTVRDRFSGTMNEGWRLNMLQPGDLGHASTYAGDVLITADVDGRSGVELREAQMSLEADSRIEKRGGKLPAVGWDHDVQALSATLNLPPGWVLVTASGVDELPGTWADEWSLLDLFFLLIIVLVVGKLAGWRWGLLALVGLGLAFQADGAPTTIWLFLLAAMALDRVLGAGRVRIPVRVLRWIAVATVVLWLLPFLVAEVRYSLFPATEDVWSWGYDYGGYQGNEDFANVDAGATAWSGDIALEQAAEQPQKAFGEKDELSRRSSSQLYETSSAPQLKRSKIALANIQNPLEVVQTGPGVPSWNWRSWDLVWSGPVTQDQQIRLVLGAPWAVGLVRILRLLLMIALALRLALGARWRRGLGMGQRATAPVAAVLLALLAVAPVNAAETPDAELLTELRTRLLAPPQCRPNCLAAAEVSLSARRDALRIVAEVHADAEAAWPIPGPAAAWVPSSVRIDGRAATGVARMGDGYLYVRLEPGVHEIIAEGPVPPSDALTLQFGLVPHRVEWAGEDWSIDGLREDGTVGSSVRLARLLEAGEEAGEGAGTAGTLPAWLQVTRDLEIGMPWRVTTTVQRVGASRAPVVLRVPLLQGESVNDEAVRVEKGEVMLSLGRDDNALSWISTLEETDRLTLTAPEGVPWTEIWTLAASPIYSFEAAGIPPIAHTQGGQWWPTWRPWPGETLDVTFQRPVGVDGQSVTIDQAELRVRPGIRMTESTLELTVRTSRGGRQALTLPEGARLQSATIDGVAYPVKPEDSRVQIPLQPGSQRLVLQWQRQAGLGTLMRTPQVDLGSSAVNAKVILELPGNRWILGAFGPGWGPAVLWWIHVAWILVVALLLGRTRSTPLKTWQWFLLGLGMTQIPVVLPLAVVGWLLLLGYRKARPPENPYAFNLLQLAVVGVTLVAMIVLYASVHTGLLLDPDMQVAGQDSWDTTLVWHVDRVDSALPRPLVASLPLWIWRVLMLLWALWMASSLVRWLRWGWRAFSTDGLVKPLSGTPRAGEQHEPPPPDAGPG